MRTREFHVLRIYPVFVPAGLVLTGLSLGLWISSHCLERLSRPPVVNFAGGMCLFSLLLVYLAALLLDIDAKRATKLVRKAVDRCRQGQFFAPQPRLKEEDLGLWPGAFSGWSDTLSLLIGQLRDQGSALVGLLDSLTPGVVLFNRRSVVMTANLSFCRFFDIDRNAVAGKGLQDLVPPAFAQRWSAHAVQAAHWCSDQVSEIRDPSSGRLFRTSLVQIRPGKAEAALLALFVEDLTELSGVQADAEELRQAYEHVLDSTSEAILLVEPDGYVKDMNRAAAEALGYERRQAAGMKLRQFLATGSTEDVEHRLDSYVLSGNWKLQGRVLEAVFARSNGSVFTAEVRLSEWRHSERRLVLVRLRDITKERQANLLTSERLQVVEMIAKHQPLDEVLAKLAEMIDHQVPASACVVMLRSGDRLSAAASPNLPSDVTRCLKALPIDSFGTSCAQAASQGRICTVPDIAAGIVPRELQQAALEHNLRASWSAPIMSREGLVVGTIAVYLREPGEPNSEQLELLEVAGRLASVCIEQHQLAGELAHRAQHDPLTGLVNRTTFEEHLKRAIAGARRRGIHLGILSIDLDRFKLVNDSLGHTVGDKLLFEVARRMESCLRETDIVARWGGDEFLVGLPELRDRQDAMMVAGKLTDVLRIPFEIDGHSIVTTATVGISLYPDDGQDLESLMRNADRAMYRAKTNGKNSFQCYTPELGEMARHRLDLENHLGRALEQHELVLHYQPLFDLTTGRIDGLEALLRWQHPQLGLVPPGSFIPVAEESGLIVPIGAWVLHEACQRLRQLGDRGLDNVHISVNVSSLQFTRPDFVDLVAQAVEEAGIKPNMLELELTESLLMKDFAQSCSRMAKLRDLGVQVAIDDFGTGYSSLSYLQRLPIDSLKIDKCFIQELGAAETASPLVQSIVGLARSLRMGATAEGVESLAQLTASRAAGCDRVQGFLFGMPLPPDDVESLIPRLQSVIMPHFLGVMPQAKRPSRRASAHMRPLASLTLPSTATLKTGLTIAR